MPQNSGQKTEQPTEKRLRDARKKGQAAQSRDLSSAVLLLAAVGVIWLVGGYIGGILQAFVTEQIEFAASFKGEFTNQTAFEAFRRGLLTMFYVLTPLFIVVVVFSFLSSFLQTGPVFSFESITPRLSRLDPAAGFRNVFFSSRSYVDLAKTVLKITIVAVVAGVVLRGAQDDLVRLMSAKPAEISFYTFRLLLEIGLKAGLIFLILGAADFFLRRYFLRRELMMTRREVREEHRETEGSPLVKARRQAAHREISSQDLAADVGGATVVLIDPAQVAVALKYERGRSNAPFLTAKGTGLMADQIRLTAERAGVPVKRDARLAREFYGLDVGREVPEKFYEAIAVVLQWVYASAEDSGKTT